MRNKKNNMGQNAILDPTTHTDFSARNKSISIDKFSYLIYFDSGLPIELNVEYTEGGRWLATNPNIMTHGVGYSPEEAVTDYESMLLDFYEELVNTEEDLSLHLLRELEQLRRILE